MTETIFVHNGQLSLAVRAVAGLALAIAGAALARRARSLSRSGFVAAAACGTLCVIAGWSWAGLLVLYFVAASGLSRAGREEKENRTGGLVSKGGERDAAQVLANGAVYSIAAALAIWIAIPWLVWGAVGALAAASADTWATEIGVWLGDDPRSIINWASLQPGESGGVTAAGMLGSAAGAAWIGLVAMLLGLPHGVGIAALVSGVGGSLADSVLGATIQERRYCNACDEPTERAVHLCGAATRRSGGIAGLDNDVVNLLSTIAGFLLGVAVYFIAGA
jgi:uncharacterized protein (TIGR00297 family)